MEKRVEMLKISSSPLHSNLEGMRLINLRGKREHLPYPFSLKFCGASDKPNLPPLPFAPLLSFEFTSPRVLYWVKCPYLSGPCESKDGN
jgi:hypothetical protein